LLYWLFELPDQVSQEINFFCNNRIRPDTIKKRIIAVGVMKDIFAVGSVDLTPTDAGGKNQLKNQIIRS